MTNAITPKEKAEELIERFEEHSTYSFNEKNELTSMHHAKQCALICVQEMQNVFATALLNFVDGMTEEKAKNAKSKYMEDLKKEIHNF